MRKLVFAAFAALAALAVPAMAAPATVAAQAAPSVGSFCPTGEVARVRVSKLKPGATMAEFEAAVAAHVAWYDKRGYKIDQQIATVMEWKDGAPSVSKDQVMTFARGDNVPRDKQDQAWTDYVAKYRAISDMEFEKVVCMPKSK